MKLKHFIDSQKAVTPFVVVIFILLFQQWQNATAWIYLSLHGTYGILWILKSRILPDKTWEQKTSLGYGLASWFGLCLFWISPWIITSRHVNAPWWLIAISISIYSLGVFFHFTSDMQKYMALKLNPGHLITDGLFGLSRNINYFGELLIYGGFSMLAMHWLPMLVLLVWIIIVWIPFMKRKEKSLSRYPEFKAYSQRTKFFIPYIY